MDPTRASFAGGARRLRRLSGPGFSFEKVEVPFGSESCHRGLPLVNR